MINFTNYFILDAAQLEHELNLANYLNKDNRCLYMGESAETLKYVAPYLFVHKRDSDFSQWLLQKKQQIGAGIFFHTKANFEQVFRHLRTLLFITTEEGEELYFRFYDPFVTSIFLPTCDSNQIREFFGPIEFFIVETETPNMFFQFWHENGELRQKQFEYPIEIDDTLEERLTLTKAQIDADQEAKDREEIERINKTYNKDNPVIIDYGDGNSEKKETPQIQKEGSAQVLMKSEAINQNITIPESVPYHNKNTTNNPTSKPETKKGGWRMFD
jgi:hypothetical protein